VLLAENDPYYVALRHLSAVAFEGYPYRAPVGGWIFDVSRITLNFKTSYVLALTKR
jgi:predicted Zn-dependent peptidase